MSAYEELVERCDMATHKIIPDEMIDAILAEVFRTLETVTPEMIGAAEWAVNSLECNEETEKECWLAMLRASPLAPPQPDGDGR